MFSFSWVSSCSPLHKAALLQSSSVKGALHLLILLALYKFTFPLKPLEFVLIADLVPPPPLFSQANSENYQYYSIRLVPVKFLWFFLTSDKSTSLASI